MIKLDPNKDVTNIDEVGVIWELYQEGGRTRPINIDDLTQNLIEVKEVFDKHNIRFVLSHGTMLGIYRDKDLIPYDDDIDIALFLEDKEKIDKASGELRDLGFFIPPYNKDPKGTANPKTETPYYDFVAMKRGEKIEGWYFEKVGDYYIYDQYRSGEDLKHPAKFYDTLGTIEWKGHKWSVPNHLDEYILMMYGEKWNIPNKNRKYNNQKFDDKGNPIPQNY